MKRVYANSGNGLPLTIRKEGEVLLAEVNIQDGESMESALRRFKRKVLNEEIIKDIKRHAYYLKPGEKKRVKAALARKRNRKKRSRDTAMEPSR
jgi:small subunit ribosomal protein S21